MTERIPIHWLHKYAYCEYQIYLEKVKGIERELTLEMQLGMDSHSALDEAHKAEAELELTVSVALEKVKEEGVVLKAREVYVKSEDLIGCIDEVVFMPNQILIIDDKPGDVAWPGNRMQTWGYCLAFEEYYNPELPLIAVLRNRDTGEKTWAELFSRRRRRDVSAAITRIRGVLDGDVEAIASRNPNKCRACGLRDSCDARSK